MKIINQELSYRWDGRAMLHKSSAGHLCLTHSFSEISENVTMNDILI